ncbi:MAG: PEGA domain-containing protein [Terracidiphilus sp.]
MKRSLLFFLLLSTLFVVEPLAARGSEPLPFNTVVVNHFTNANGMTFSQDFIQYFSDYLRQRLVKDKVAAQVVDQGTTVPDAVAANSLVIDGKYTGHENAAFMKPGKVFVELSIYRLSDHALVKDWNVTTYFVPNSDHKDKTYAYYTALPVGDIIWNALKGVSLSSIPPAAPGAGSATPGAAAAPSSATAPAGPDAVASVQLSSDPTGAEITIDGNYVGSTPSTVNLKPGVHSIKMTMPGYAPWVRSIETEAGESRSFAADLEKTSQ